MVDFQWVWVECIFEKKRKIVEVGGREIAVGRQAAVAFGQRRSIEATI